MLLMMSPMWEIWNQSDNNGPVKCNLYWLVLATQSDWEMFGDSHIYAIKVAVVRIVMIFFSSKLFTSKWNFILAFFFPLFRHIFSTIFYNIVRMWYSNAVYGIGHRSVHWTRSHWSDRSALSSIQRYSNQKSKLSEFHVNTSKNSIRFFRRGHGQCCCFIFDVHILQCDNCLCYLLLFCCIPTWNSMARLCT